MRAGVTALRQPYGKKAFRVLANDGVESDCKAHFAIQHVSCTSGNNRIVRQPALRRVESRRSQTRCRPVRCEIRFVLRRQLVAVWRLLVKSVSLSLPFCASPFGLEQTMVLYSFLLSVGVRSGGWHAWCYFEGGLESALSTLQLGYRSLKHLRRIAAWMTLRRPKCMP